MSSPEDIPQKQPRVMTSSDQFGGRLYTHPVTGETFRSVTTILSASSKPALERWKIKTVSEFAAENRAMLAGMERDAAFDLVRSSQFTSSGSAAATGEAVHSRLEGLCNAHQSGGDLEVARWVAANPAPPELDHVDKMFGELLTEFEIEVLYTEATLINRTVGYAGSADLIARIRPRPFYASNPAWKTAVIDAKSGKSIYGSVALQLVGYGKAEHILLPNGSEIPMPVVHESFALHVRPRSWALRPMLYTREVWDAFRALVVVDKWINQVERSAVGDAVNAGAISRKRSYNSAYSTAASDGASDAASAA